MKMKRKIAILFAALCLTVLAGAAGAEEKVNGTVKSIDLDAKTVVVTSFEGQEVTITISDEDTVTLVKLKEKRIKVEDDVKVKYVKKDGKNVATYFRKPAGC
jgi:ABC-type glycerol-3-phosphate transport system substrate-binding protein